MKFYRYVAHTYFGSDTQIELDIFILLRETEKGYWIIPQYCEYSDNSWKESMKKWIPKKSKKRFAYPTKKEAMQNFVARTSKYVVILSTRLKQANVALQKATKIFEDKSYERDSL